DNWSISNIAPEDIREAYRTTHGAALPHIDVGADRAVRRGPAQRQRLVAASASEPAVAGIADHSHAVHPADTGSLSGGWIAEAMEAKDLAGVAVAQADQEEALSVRV